MKGVGMNKNQAHKRKKSLPCIRGKIPDLPYKPTQKEMIKLAMRDIKLKRKGKYRLAYNKETKSIIAEEIK